MLHTPILFLIFNRPDLTMQVFAIIREIQPKYFYIAADGHRKDKEGEEGIILEDDCLLDLSFFRYCEELLSKYRDCEKVMHISGNNFQNGIIRGKDSYHFSKFPHIWGWATWKNAWQKYDFKMKNLETLYSTNLSIIFDNKSFLNYWINNFNKTKQGIINTWDYQWLYSVWINEGLSILPNKNLVENCCFGINGTHCIKDDAISHKRKVNIYF